MRLPLSPDGDRIGPNAITQVIAALKDRVGLASTRSCFEAAGLIDYLESPPETMVSERHVAMLQATLREVLGPALAHEVSRDAGYRTGDYLLANQWMPSDSIFTIAGVLAPEPPTTIRDERPGRATPPRR